MNPLPYLMMCFYPSLPCDSPVINIARGVWSYGFMLITLSPMQLSALRISETCLFIHSLIYLFCFLFVFSPPEKPPWQPCVACVSACYSVCLRGCSLELVGGGWGPPPAHSHRHGSIAQHVSVYLSCKQRTCRGLGQSWSKLSHKIGTQEFVGDTSTWECVVWIDHYIVIYWLFF